MTRAIILSILALLLIGAPSAAQEPGDTAQQRPAQLLKPGDIIDLRVWREPDFTGEYSVDANGYVTLPRLGQVRVIDYTSIGLERELIERYSEYLRNPSIEVIVRRRIRIVGAVSQPGLYPVDATITIADALALAGGVTSVGNPDKVELRREGRVLAGNLSTNVALAETPLQSGDELNVPERSWISRNSGVVAALVGGVLSLVVALTR